MADSALSPTIVRKLGVVPCAAAWHAMQDFTQRRSAATPDELWLVEHPPVYTLGLNGKREHLLRETSIPVLQIDRGGQITYHGPGQFIVYTLIDLRRGRMGVRDMVRRLEAAVITLLAGYRVAAVGDPQRPGVYVDGAKIAALGLRVKRGCTYHGLALNVEMDLGPFAAINPCGYRGLKVTQLRDLGVDADLARVRDELLVNVRSCLES